MKFKIPGKKGQYTIGQIVQVYRDEVALHGRENIKVMIGTDSQRFSDQYHFVTAFTLHRVGKGGRVFYHKKKLDVKQFPTIQIRMLREAQHSLDVATKFTELLQEVADVNITSKIEIHLDVNPDEIHASNDVLKAVTGWVHGMGYKAKTKPDAVCASTVADRYAIGQAQ